MLAVITVLTYRPVLGCGFINFDDDTYVTNNPHVKGGLTWDELRWGLTTLYAANWHPLAWWSLQADAQLFGPSPRGFHLTNLFWHLANTLLLFAGLRWLTGSCGRSFFVSALFAVHPLHVESVAWVSERKDVLSTFFALLALGAYARYACAPSLGRYSLVALAMALSLMAKPMMVTLPLLLLLMDYWPLKRWPVEGKEASSSRPLRRLLLEKVPLVGLSLASCVVTMWAQQTGGAVRSLAEMTFSARLGNAVVSYLQYLRQTLLPLDLTIFYPHPGNTLGAGTVVGAALLLGLITGFVWLGSRRFAYLPVGWLWSIGTLVPVIGLVQVGIQARADRYTYVPLIGLCVLAVWGLADLARRWQLSRLLASLGVVILGYFMLLTWTQLHYWHDSLLLWEHALQVTKENHLAHNYLGHALVIRRERQEGIAHYREALRIRPDYTDAHFGMGLALLDDRQIPEAMQQFREVVQLVPNHIAGHHFLAKVLQEQGRTSEAIEELHEVLRINPDFVAASIDLGLIALAQEKPADAVTHFQDALRLEPENAVLHGHLGLARAQRQEWRQAAACFQRAAELAPWKTVYRRSYHEAMDHLLGHGKHAMKSEVRRFGE